MKKLYLMACVLILATSTASAADPEAFLKSAPMPFYPPLARQARVERTVTLRVTIDQDGNAKDVEALSGHPLLRNATVEYVKGWKLAWSHPCFCTVKRDVTFLYKISGKEATADSPLATVRWFGISRVEIETAPPLEITVGY